ncbi:Vitamin B12-binding protein precursor [Pelotomaculum sp. FP]|uniref:ABC transporter substrate-binding protein n=1 Tax=Pelotomaculum sp. FP TaxID=261474 RepID=UPI0010653B3E|nr:cobalamin-binding protein [Pelotomaculum sp. FP]TEB13936.1 Vitamin B12-binding protein precursor [Pelotomaculum sp. FP]
MVIEKKSRLTFKAACCVLLALVVAVLLQGCGKAEPIASGSGFPMTVTDDLGRQVTINKAPQRIVSLVPATTETLFALGLGDKLVGVTEYCDYPAEALAKPKIGGFSTPNSELIVAAQPDLVLATNIHKEYIPLLEKAGLTVVATNPLNLAQVVETIKLIGRITGAATEADNLASDMEQRINMVHAKVRDLPDDKKPDVFFEIWPDPLTTGGAKSFINSLIVTAGGKNIAGDVDQDWVTFSPEMVLSHNPQVIIFCYHGASLLTAEQIKGRIGWEKVEAIKNNRVEFLPDQDIVTRTGPRVVESLELVAKSIHPELFDKQL